MWDWDGFFIGLHWANQDPADAKYLRDWVLGFAGSADAEGYVAGCITPKGPRPLFGKFAMKPFLAQGASSPPKPPRLQLDPPCLARDEARPRLSPPHPVRRKWKLWFWDNAMQSGADNNAALTNDPNDRSAILAVDASVYAMREYLAMAAIATHLGDPAMRRFTRPKPSPLGTPSCASFGLRKTPCSGIAVATGRVRVIAGPTFFLSSTASSPRTKAAA